MKNPELVILAAGMGSRYGGLKQIDKIDDYGHIIIDYSIYDAIKAGFRDITFIIKKEIEKDFREIAGKRIEKMIDVDYAFQDLNDLPSPFTVPEGRVKPWGTGQAVLCAKNVVNSPFAVINSDDFYGKGGYVELKKHFENSNETCMVGYKLCNTVTENGTVSRGICEISDGYLKSVVETHEIPFNNNYPEDTIVSMNMWGFEPTLFDVLEDKFVEFLKEKGMEQKSEYLLPFVVDEMIKTKGEKVKMLYADDKWYGVTYKEDKQSVVDAIADFCKKGMYNKFN